MALDLPFDGNLSCPDWWERLCRQEVPMCDLPISEAHAAPALRCFNQLRVPDVVGQPKFADAGMDWFKSIVGALWGCVDPKTGVRHIRELFLLVPKKNGKSTGSAALGLTALLLNDIPNAEMLIIGPTQKAAENCFGQAMGMVKADPKLSQILHIQEHRSKITNRLTGAELSIKSFDMNVVTGGIPIFAIIDELHLMSSRSYAKKVIGQIRGGMNKMNCLLIFITTQSAEEPAGVFKSELYHARRVRDGEVSSEGKLVVTYEFPEAVQRDKSKPFLSPQFWPMVLPNIGYSVDLELLESKFREEQQKGVEDAQLWLSQHLNIQIGLGLHSDRWVGADHWEAAEQDDLTLQEIMETSEVCVVGIDGGGLDDLLGLAVIGRHRETEAWQHWAKAWVHEDVLTSRKEIAERLQDFEALGDLVIITDENQIDEIEEVVAVISDLMEAGLLPDAGAVGLDPEGVGEIVDALDAIGLTDKQVLPVSQGYKLNAAINGLPRLLKRGKFVHCGQELMAWCVGNAKTEMRGNAKVVTKQRSGLAKIDPLMATFDAVMLMNLNPTAGPPATPWDMDPEYRMAS